jgi:hypothetical protein
MNIKLPESIWQAANLKEIGKMPTKRLILLLLPHYLTAAGALLGGASLSIMALLFALRKFGF